MYAELEFTLASALNDYLSTQFNAGRLEPDKLKKVAEAWQQKGRPKVVGFRYDLETQLDLVRMHVNDFKFYGRAATNTAILGILDMMRIDARSIRVRTYCQPDTVVAKQLLDTQNLFNVLGCPETQQLQLAEITGLFKAAMERERLFATRESTAETPLRHAKSHSGERWQAAKGQEIRRTASHAGGLRMDPAACDEAACDDEDEA